LKDTQDVPFAVVPDNADMDRVPISLYEAQRLASITEIADLEKWLLSDIDLCKDIAEFSAFVHALRGGALQQWAELPAAAADAGDTPKPKPKPAETPQQVSEPTPKTAPMVTHDNNLPPVDTEPVSAEVQDERGDEETPTTPAPKPGETPKSGGAMMAILITGATIAGAVVLLVMIMIYALRAG
jgi:hypothetical protein